MNESNTQQTIVVGTGRGLSIAGTQMTLYSIMDYSKLSGYNHLIGMNRANKGNYK